MTRQSAINMVNGALALFLSGPMRMVHVIEYPKCGGTWLARMLRTYRGVEREFGHTRIARMHSVIQEHCLYRRRYARPVIVVRDPRDVWVSFFFHETQSGPSAEVLRGIGFDPGAGDARNLEAYVRFKLDHPLEGRPGFSYESFVDAWIGKPRITVVRYEEMHRDTPGELARILRGIGEEPDPARIASSVAANSFLAITGRHPGDEDRSSHKRKGVVGDWRNYFTPHLSALVAERQARLFSRLGYDPGDGQGPSCAAAGRTTC
jgi:hypothetical protein